MKKSKNFYWSLTDFNLDHKYNTRSRQRLLDEPEPDISGKHRRVPMSSIRPCIPVSCVPECCVEPEEPTSAFAKYCRIVKIVLAVSLLFGLILYISDRHLNSLRLDLNNLKQHIQNMQHDLHSVAKKKVDVDKHLTDIASALPALKEMADNVLDDVNKKRDDKLTDYMRNVVKEELEQYNADKTGRTDFALESSGGLVIGTRKTESYAGAGAALSLFGIPLCHSTNTPTALIQPGVMPGECWAFKGSAGSAVIQLINKIHVTGISVEHIARTISPTGETTTAPKEFSVWGLQSADDTDGFFFGKFTYDLQGLALQYFPVQHKSSRKFDIIEFRVHSNHGHPEYTCIYRVRVHGDL